MTTAPDFAGLPVFQPGYRLPSGDDLNRLRDRLRNVSVEAEDFRDENLDGDNWAPAINRAIQFVHATWGGGAVRLRGRGPSAPYMVGEVPAVGGVPNATCIMMYEGVSLIGDGQTSTYILMKPGTRAHMVRIQPADGDTFLDGSFLVGLTLDMNAPNNISGLGYHLVRMTTARLCGILDCTLRQAVGFTVTRFPTAVGAGRCIFVNVNVENPNSTAFDYHTGDSDTFEYQFDYYQNINITGVNYDRAVAQRNPNPAKPVMQLRTRSFFVGVRIAADVGSTRKMVGMAFRGGAEGSHVTQAYFSGPLNSGILTMPRGVTGSQIAGFNGLAQVISVANNYVGEIDTGEVQFSAVYAEACDFGALIDGPGGRFQLLANGCTSAGVKWGSNGKNTTVYLSHANMGASARASICNPGATGNAEVIESELNSAMVRPFSHSEFVAVSYAGNKAKATYAALFRLMSYNDAGSSLYMPGGAADAQVTLPPLTAGAYVWVGKTDAFAGGTVQIGDGVNTNLAALKAKGEFALMEAQNLGDGAGLRWLPSGYWTGVPGAPVPLAANDWSANFAGDSYSVGGFGADFTSLFTYTCAFAGKRYAQRLDGLWVGFDSGVPRITDQGYLDEGARTHSALWARDMTQAPWVKTGAPTVALDADGIDGTPAAASSITLTGASATVLQTLVLGAASYVTAPFIRYRQGAPQVQVTIDGGGTWTDYTANMSTSYFRCPVTKNAANPVLGLRITGSVGDAVEVDFCGCSDGATASSPLETQAVALTRPVDVLSLNYPGLVSLDTGTLRLIARQPVQTSVLGRIFYARRVDDNNRVYLGNTSANLASGVMTAGGVGTFTGNSTAAIVAGTSYRQALAYSAADQAEAFSLALRPAGTVLTGAGAVPTGQADAVRFGGEPGGSADHFFGYCQSFEYFVARKSNAELLAWALA